MEVALSLRSARLPSYAHVAERDRPSELAAARKDHRLRKAARRLAEQELIWRAVKVGKDDVKLLVSIHIA